jgi:hypothetical protein
VSALPCADLHRDAPRAPPRSPPHRVVSRRVALPQGARSLHSSCAPSSPNPTPSAPSATPANSHTSAEKMQDVFAQVAAAGVVPAPTIFPEE